MHACVHVLVLKGKQPLRLQFSAARVCAKWMPLLLACLPIPFSISRLLEQL